MLLLLKETWKEDRFSMERNYNRNVDALLAFKKSCGNTIKFASQNIPHALIQVSWIFQNELNISTVHRTLFDITYLQAVYCHSIIAVYCFGMITLMARNFSNEQNSSHVVSGYLPLMPGMQVTKLTVRNFNNDFKLNQTYSSRCLDSSLFTWRGSGRFFLFVLILILSLSSQFFVYFA